MRSRRLVLTAVAGVALVGAAAPVVASDGTSTNLVNNGSFERPDLPRGALVTYQPSGPRLPGWTVSFAVDVADGGYAHAGRGTQSLDLNGGRFGGALCQVVSVAPSTHYKLTMLVAGNPHGGPRLKGGEVYLLGSSVEYVHDRPYARTGTVLDMGWTRRRWAFTTVATEHSVRLCMDNDTPSPYGLMVDDIRIEVAEQ